MHPVGDASFQGKTGSSLRYTTAIGTFELELCDPRIVRFHATGAEAPIRLAAPRESGAARLVLQGDPAAAAPVTIVTPHLAVSVDPKPFRLSLADPQGKPLLSDLTVVADENGGRWQIWLTAPMGQHFYGLGHGGQQIDRLGGVRQLWNSHVGQGPGSDIGIPLLLTNKGYGLFFDCAADARLTLGRSDQGLRLVYDAEAGVPDLYLIAGANPRELLAAAADLLGHAPMPPRWFLGYLQSTRHFDSTDELRSLPKELRSRRIPCDGLIFLSTYGEALGWNRMVGHLEFEPTLWADAPALVAEMRGQHFEVMTHEYPVLHPASPAFGEAQKKGYVIEAGYPNEGPPRPPASYREGQRYVDFSNPEARAWWWEQHRHLRDLGVSAWWLDGGEGPPGSARLAAGSGSALHNLYDLMRYQAFAEGEARDRPDLRPVLLCRSGGAGMQRLGAACWSGDVDNTFSTLAAQIPLGLNTGVSGVPYWGTDIGGFFQPVPESGELFARWWQLGAFSPVFRAHGRVWREHLPWAHGPEVEAICRKYAELRYRLLPYIYSLAWQAATQGLPLMRPLWMDFPDDPRVWDMGSEYLWGDGILVAPVTREGARRWAVYLPRGAWYDFWTQERYAGGQAVEVDAPLDRLPLFLREGSIIPMGPLVQHTGEAPLVDVTLLITPHAEPDGGTAASSSFELYEDDGRTNAYRRGARAVTPIRCSRQRGSTALEIGEAQGDSSVIPAGRSYTLQIRAARPSLVLLDSARAASLAPGERGKKPGWWYEEGFVFVRPAGRSAAVVIKD